jgi:undecaprenyl-diphosphatase
LEWIFLNQLNEKLKINKIKFYSKLNRQDNGSILLRSAIYLLAAATTLASYMIWHYYSYGHWAMDAAMQDFVKGARTSWLTTVFRAITATGETIPVIIAAAVVVLSLVIYRKRSEGIIVAACMLGVWRLNEFLKQLLHRPRIDASQHLVDISGYNHNNSFSLPSGHSMNFMALVLLTLYFIWIYSNNKKLKVGATLVLLPYGLLVGISRVYLNVHYFSDVVTGWSVGIACASIAIIVHRIICLRKNRQGI